MTYYSVTQAYSEKKFECSYQESNLRPFRPSNQVHGTNILHTARIGMSCVASDAHLNKCGKGTYWCLFLVVIVVVVVVVFCFVGVVSCFFFFFFCFQSRDYLSTGKFEILVAILGKRLKCSIGFYLLV